MLALPSMPVLTSDPTLMQQSLSLLLKWLISRTRKVSAVTTVRFAEGDKLEEGPTVPTVGVSPALLKPCLKKVSLTQRSATYSKKKGDE